MSYRIPFDQITGAQQHYPEPSYHPTERCERGYAKRIEPAWRDNFMFDGTLVFKGYMRGRSAAYFKFEAQTEEKRFGVTVFLTDFEEMIPEMVRGAVLGRFTFTKRGTNYGCKLA